MRKKKAAPKPAPAPVLMAKVLAFVPMSQVGELFELASARGWKTHTEMPFIDEGGVMKSVVSEPNAI